jgi:hypothetical protein
LEGRAEASFSVSSASSGKAAPAHLPPLPCWVGLDLLITNCHRLKASKLDEASSVCIEWIDTADLEAAITASCQTGALVDPSFNSQIPPAFLCVSPPAYRA